MADRFEGIIKWNKIQCLNCKDVIESKSKHDDVIWCSCGNCGIAGGLSQPLREIGENVPNDVIPYISMTRRIVRALVRE